MARTPGSTTKNRRVTDARQRVWNAMIIYKRFTSLEIQAAANVGRSNLDKYMKALQRAGYVRIERRRQSGKTLGHAIWILARSTGPKSPIIRNDGSGVFDPNEDRLYPLRVDAKERRDEVADGAA